MQVVPPGSLQVGVSYRIHNNAEPDGTLDTLGTFIRHVRYMHNPPSIVAQFNHICEPVFNAVYNADGTFPHRCRPPNSIMNADHEIFTFYLNASAIALRRVISAKTGRRVDDPRIYGFLGRKHRSRNKKMRRKRSSSIKAL